MTSHRVRFAAMGVLAITLVLPLCAAAATQPPQTTFDGLELRPKTKLAVVYLRPDADFSGYRKVALLDCAVAFKKDWQRNQNSTNPLAISAKDMDDIRKALGTMFSEVFRDVLTKGGYELTDKAGDDVLVLRPAIIDLNISSPAAAEAGRSKTYATVRRRDDDVSRSLRLEHQRDPRPHRRPQTGHRLRAHDVAELGHQQNRGAQDADRMGGNAARGSRRVAREPASAGRTGDGGSSIVRLT